MKPYTPPRFEVDNTGIPDFRLTLSGEYAVGYILDTLPLEELKAVVSAAWEEVMDGISPPESWDLPDLQSFAHWARRFTWWTLFHVRPGWPNGRIDNAVRHLSPWQRVPGASLEHVFAKYQ